MKQCTCRICRYHREYRKHLKNVPSESRQFFVNLYERYSMADDERDYLNMKLNEYQGKKEKKMDKYIADECEQCDEWFECYNCMNHECPIYRDYMIDRAEIAADDEHDRRKDKRMEEEKENE